MQVKLEKSWMNALDSELLMPYFTELSATVRNAYLGHEPVYPPPQLVFNAFTLCPFNSVKVVILGQDPYHGEGQAHGLCFSVQNDMRIPPSLQNIYKELRVDIQNLSKGSPCSKETGDLTHWAKQGVLLLNATLTVEAGKPGSHHGIGWGQFTDAVVKKLSDEKEHLVFILWGKYAQEKGAVIDRKRHLVLSAPHPSPLSAHTGFFGSKPFSTANAYLKEHGVSPLHW